MRQGYEYQIPGDSNLRRLLYKNSTLPSSDPEVTRTKIKLKKPIRINEKNCWYIFISSSKKNDGIITKKGVSYPFINAITKEYPNEKIMLIIERDRKGNPIYTPKEQHSAFATKKSFGKSIEEKTKEELIEGLESMTDD